MCGCKRSALTTILVFSVGVAALFATALRASATVTRDDFLVSTTAGLVKVCTAEESDPLYQAAIGFCHGYVVGAYHYHQALTEGANAKKLVCAPEPRPSRAESIKRFVAWSQAHPEHNDALPVETMVRFLVDTWPCQK